MLKQFWEGIKSIFSNFINIISEMIKSFIGYITNFIANSWESIKNTTI